MSEEGNSSDLLRAIRNVYCRRRDDGWYGMECERAEEVRSGLPGEDTCARARALQLFYSVDKASLALET